MNNEEKKKAENDKAADVNPEPLKVSKAILTRQRERLL